MKKTLLMAIAIAFSATTAFAVDSGGAKAGEEMTCTVVSVDAAANQATLDHNGQQHTVTLSDDSSPIGELKQGDNVHVVMGEAGEAAVHKL